MNHKISECEFENIESKRNWRMLIKINEIKNEKDSFDLG